ncbi:MAG: hypothetical protein JEZ00_15855 [Anaerolineaceae bacterium]|nr:hypothetical protein [Anaerolineaceae bacterium]
MENTPYVFISYCAQQTELKIFLSSLLEDLDFSCLTLEESRNASIDEARSLITRADCYVGLLTPDVKTHDGRYVCRESINIQLGLAYSAKIPIQLFAFDNVDVSNIVFPLTHSIAKVQRFKTKFGKSIIFDAHNMRLLFKTLLDFKKQITLISAIQEKAHV